MKALVSVPLASVAVSSLTVGELMLGVNLSANPERELAKVEAFLLPIHVIPFDRDEAYQWAELEAHLRKQGNPIEAEDAMIAATAKTHGLTLVSGNTKHFARVPDWELTDWQHQPPK